MDGEQEWLEYANKTQRNEVDYSPFKASDSVGIILVLEGVDGPLSSIR